MKKSIFKTVILSALMILLFCSQAFAAINEVEPNDLLESAMPIELNQPYIGDFDYPNRDSDSDHFVFSIDEKSTIQLKIEYEGQLPPGITVFVIDNSNPVFSGVVVDEALSYDNVSSPWYSNEVILEPGDYTVLLSAGLYTSEILSYPDDYTLTVIKDGGSEPPVFGEMRPSAWAVDEVNQAIESGLVMDYLQSEYQSNITRAEFCSLIVSMILERKALTEAELIEVYSIDLGKQNFSDTPDSSYIDVDIAYSLGIVNGFADGTFKPDYSITRQEAATMLKNTADVFDFPTDNQNLPNFSDKADIGSWAIPGVNFVASQGIMGGVGDNTFSPQTTYTREQSIITSLRLFQALLYGGY